MPTIIFFQPHKYMMMFLNQIPKWLELGSYWSVEQ